MRLCKAEAGAVAGREKFGFPSRAAVPDGTDGMYDVTGLQSITLGHPGLAGRTSPDAPALPEKFGAGRPVYGAINAAAAQQGMVGCVHDGIDIQCGDVGDAR